MRVFVRGLLLSSVLLIVGCGSLDQPDNPQVVGGSTVVTFDQALMKKTLTSKGYADENSTVFGYTAYKIPYKTTNEKGVEVSVSGLMVVPTGLPEVVTEHIGLSLVSDDHGTIFANYEAPTIIGETTSAPAGSAIILTALAGFVTLQPDYIGFGDSDDIHPFVLKKSLANATVDFIIAAREFATSNSIKLNGQLFLTGYSEGGYAALATLQKIEAEGNLTVTMAAPMAGPYAMEAMAMGVLSQPKLTVPSFMANVGYAYADAYDKEFTSIINEPYASKLKNLFSGDYNRTQIDVELTYDTTGDSGLFAQSIVTGFFTDADNWFRKAVVENSIHKWSAKTPVRLVHCMGDDVIPYGISQMAEGNMQAMGSADTKIVPVEIAVTKDPATALRYGHADCGSVAYSVTAKMFGDIRKSTMGY